MRQQPHGGAAIAACLAYRYTGLRGVLPVPPVATGGGIYASPPPPPLVHGSWTATR
jgi:hypothetical protein